MNPILIPDWNEKVVFSHEGPQPQPLIVADHLKSVLVGLEPGQKIPPHPAPLAVYHFLEGEGVMWVNGEPLPVQAGATVIVPEGAVRGMDAKTQLAFLGTHRGEH
ncbi:MAG: cupin domain-containing protein [Anaerolineales bacterium]|jgi:quercetin dioxygenase-like cupin family protein|nr:cupin domain-containing protein [Anaerolineales bacterium]